MSDKQIIKDFEHGGKRVEVKVSYTLGGMNYFTSKAERRGYYIHVTPYERSEVKGGFIRAYTGFSGIKMLLVECSRKSAKKMQEAVEMVTDEMIESLLAECKFD